MPLPSLNRSTSEIPGQSRHALPARSQQKRASTGQSAYRGGECRLYAHASVHALLLEGFARPACATSSYPATAEIHCTKTSMVARRVWLGA